MAKIRHNNFLETVNELIGDATREGVLHLYAEGNEFNGRNIEIGGKSLYHFGTTGYLGLEQDIRLKTAAINAIERFGTQFPLSKSYISHPLYEELEELLEEMYGYPVVVTKNSTLGHLGVIPTIVGSSDAIILDHQVHWSVQSACRLLKPQGVVVDMIRHNQLDMLEERIKFHSNKRRKIWYMADGIYSMFGDYAPVMELRELARKYSQLQLYFDDVHGMSWIGKHGTGYVLDQLGELSDRILVFGTLSKTFGASGAVLVCPNKVLHKKIKTFGGPLTFSAQLEPSVVGAAIASARIHLSPEIYGLQQELQERIQYFNDLLKGTGIPVVDHNESPVFYVGTGVPETGYNFVNRLMKKGFYTNLGLFPAVPVKNTGVRITISRHNQKEDIKALVDAMEDQYPKSLEDSRTNLDRVRNVFGLGLPPEVGTKKETGLVVNLYDSISDVDKDLWNSRIGRNGTMDWDGLHYLENCFSKNGSKEHDWKFIYVSIHDTHGTPILLTFMTVSLWKDDMLSPESVSKGLEGKRKTDPYILTSKVLSLGSLFTEGQHLFLDNDHHLKDEALRSLLARLENMENEFGTKMTVLRDFGADNPIQKFLLGQGFIKVRMPESCTLDLPFGTSIESHIGQLSARNRRHFRKEILPFEEQFDVEVLDNCDMAILKRIHELYRNVQTYNLGMNTFPFPLKVVSKMTAYPNWEFLTLRIKESDDNPIVGVMLCYKNPQGTFVPAFVGMDYKYVRSHNIYRQLLYQTIKRAIALQFERIDFGMTAAFEKRKLGAKIHETFAYVQTADNYKLELLGLLEGQEKD
ncbi:aminotransferase class I/II-fold pyridoxal phosphate-dependent enzyme [Flagellimonas sp.]|uniref:aminotransferase class I/II-fold pyridoxal phosphate-dependent enzyme n=1 Tax=Flagellimonas sp. TaxID=2058762 RepID=UPI003AB3DBD5